PVLRVYVPAGASEGTVQAAPYWRLCPAPNDCPSYQVWNAFWPFGSQISRSIRAVPAAPLVTRTVEGTAAPRGTAAGPKPSYTAAGLTLRSTAYPGAGRAVLVAVAARVAVGVGLRTGVLVGPPPGLAPGRGNAPAA